MQKLLALKHCALHVRSALRLSEGWTRSLVMLSRTPKRHAYFNSALRGGVMVRLLMTTVVPASNRPFPLKSYNDLLQCFEIVHLVK